MQCGVVVGAGERGGFYQETVPRATLAISQAYRPKDILQIRTGREQKPLLSELHFAKLRESH